MGQEATRSIQRSEGNSLANAETLAYYDKDAKTKVVADASSEEHGAVLFQEQHGQSRPMTYASTSLTAVEREKHWLWSGLVKVSTFIYSGRVLMETESTDEKR